MTLVAEQMLIGAKTDSIKSKKVQTTSEEIGLKADNTLETQQGDGKAVVKLADGKASITSDKNDIHGETTIDSDTEVKTALKAPKATIDKLEAKSSLKSPNISDGAA